MNDFLKQAYVINRLNFKGDEVETERLIFDLILHFLNIEIMKTSMLVLGKVVVYAIFLIMVVLLGIFGFIDYYNELKSPICFTGLVYDIFRLFVLGHTFPSHSVPIALDIARLTAPLMLATAVIDIFYSHFKKFIDILVIRLFYRNHIVFCGFGYKSKMIAEFYREDNVKIVIIEINSMNNHINEFRCRNVKILSGDSTAIKSLSNANINKATRVYIATGNDITNLQIIKRIQEIFNTSRLKVKSKSLVQIQITVETDDSASQRFFKEFQEEKSNYFEINSINIYQKFAAYLVDKYCPDKYLSLCKPIDSPASVLILGFEKLAENIILEAALLYHFPHFKQTNILVCTNDTGKSQQIFLCKFPHISKIVKLTFVDEDIFYEHKFKSIAKEVSVCFICGTDDAEDFLKAKRLRQKFFDLFFMGMENNLLDESDKKRLLNFPPIVLTSTMTTNIYSLFYTVSKVTTTLNIMIERMYQSVCSKEQMVHDHEFTDDIAQQIHNRYLGLDNKELDIAWENLSDEGKDQNRRAAKHFAIKLRYLGIALVDKANQDRNLLTTVLSYLKDVKKDKKLNVIAQMEHNRWIAEKLITGYIPGKPINDMDYYLTLKEVLKWHKDIRPWEELSDLDKKKDEMMNDVECIISNLTYKTAIFWPK